MGNSKEQKIAEPLKGYSSKDIEMRIIKSFLDILILIEMKKQSSLSGYDITTLINSKFGGMLSPGTVYAMLYSIERKGLIKGALFGRKTVYTLTEQGEVIVNSVMANFNKDMVDFAKKFLTQ